MSTETRRVPVHQSLLRPNLLAGGERTLSLLNGAISAALVFGVPGIASKVAGIAFGMAAQWILVLVARRDPQAMDVYRRHIRIEKFYPAAAFARKASGALSRRWKPGNS